MAIAQKEKELIKDSFKRVTYLLLTMLGASVLFFIISQYINKRIRYNFNSFISEFETAISKHQMLKEDKFNLNELKRLSSSTNKLLEKHLKSLDELQLSEQKMRALNSTKDKFFSIIAHDLRNPFNALITLSSFLVDAIDSNDKEEAKELASIIETSSKQGFELLVNLLEWSRTQTGAIKYNPNLINLNRELKNPIQIIESIAESKQIRFKHDINKNITAFADPNMIRTIVRNLLSNAVKFTPRVGIISIEANENETEIVIKIRDNGVGMSQEIIDDLFTIDVNTSAQGTEGETGTGLGLILCFEFVKKHKGRIWVESEKGKGSCFSFSIPKETTKP
ncbi:HAMP domain-containing sensor histidine kinase [Ancylomarina subtilis]